MGNQLADKVAVITGAAGGIGRGIALTFAGEGAMVVVNDLGCAVDGSGTSAEPADRVVAEIKKMGGEAAANYDTVTTIEGGQNIIKTAVDNFGRIDILVNNAGILRDRMIFNMAPEEWDDVLKVNLYGAFHCTKPASALMRQQRSGRIISMTSPSGLTGNSGQANYGAAKAGIAGFTRVCARDLGKYGITVNAVVPNAATRMTMSEELLAAAKLRADKGIASLDKSAMIGLDGSIPPDPLDVAPMVVFLASNAASDINGCILGAGGGRVDLYSHPEPIKSVFKNGRWTSAELADIIPTTLAADLINPAPPIPPQSQ
jgi:NAD(P)-dependent dehydrogenase (short-subunit alcohol dehydrogenase family)